MFFRACSRIAQNGGTALTNCAMMGHFDCIRLLLEAGADVNAKGPVRASTFMSYLSLNF